MRWMDRLLPAPPQLAPRVRQEIDARLEASRRELLALAVESTLKKCGIPPGWIHAEASPAITFRNERGIRLRLVVREGQALLQGHGIGLQALVQIYLARLDPASPQWLDSISWEFDADDASNCPTMPAELYRQRIADRGVTGRGNSASRSWES